MIGFLAGTFLHNVPVLKSFGSFFQCEGPRILLLLPEEECCRLRVGPCAEARSEPIPPFLLFLLYFFLRLVYFFLYIIYIIRKQFKVNTLVYSVVERSASLGLSYYDSSHNYLLTFHPFRLLSIVRNCCGLSELGYPFMIPPISNL